MLSGKPKAPRCLSCARPMDLTRRTARFGTLPDLFSFNCVACNELHLVEGDTLVTRMPGENLPRAASRG